MSEVSPRLLRRIRRDHDPATVAWILAELADVPEGLPLGERQDPERMQAALVVGHDGSRERLERRLTTLRRDWRDALMAAGLAQPDWPERLDDELGPRP